MSKNNSGCRCGVLRIVLASGNILALPRSVKLSPQPFEPRWRETLSQLASFRSPTTRWTVLESLPPIRFTAVLNRGGSKRIGEPLALDG